MLETIFLIIILFLLVLLTLSVFLLVNKNALLEKFLVMQLMGTVIVALIVILAGIAWHNDLLLNAQGFIDVALCTAILAIFTITTFIQKLWIRRDR